MPDEISMTAEESYKIADGFAQASARILDFRVDNSASLSEKEASELEECEDKLDFMVILFRNYGIQLIGKGAENAVAKLTPAIDSARQAIERITNIKKAVKIAGGLADLAVSVLAKNPKSIIEAAKSIELATNDKKT